MYHQSGGYERITMRKAEIIEARGVCKGNFIRWWSTRRSGMQEKDKGRCVCWGGEGDGDEHNIRMIVQVRDGEAGKEWRSLLCQSEKDTERAKEVGRAEKCRKTTRHW